MVDACAAVTCRWQGDVVTTPLPLALEVQRLPQPVQASAEVCDSCMVVDSSSGLQNNSNVGGLEMQLSSMRGTN